MLEFTTRKHIGTKIRTSCPSAPFYWEEREEFYSCTTAEGEEWIESVIQHPDGSETIKRTPTKYLDSRIPERHMESKPTFEGRGPDFRYPEELLGIRIY